jgi:multiple sugar transport system ATP-binding protein
MGEQGTGFRTEVFLTEPLGSEVIVNVRIGERLVKVRTAPDVRPQPGEIVSLSPDPAGIRLYDATTGAAIP